MIEKISNALLNDDLHAFKLLLQAERSEQHFSVLSSLYEMGEKKPPLDHMKSRPPGAISVMPSYTCSLRCGMCNAGFHDKSAIYEDYKYLEPHEFEMISPWLNQSEWVIFCGLGETMDSPFVIDYLKSLSHKKTSLQTSGVSLTEEKTKQLIDVRLNHLCLSYDGKTSLGHGSGKDSYIEKIWNRIASVNHVKRTMKIVFPTISLAVTVNSENVDTLDEIFLRAQKSGVNGVGLYPMSDPRRDLYEKTIYSDFEKNRKKINKMIRHWNSAGLHVTFLANYKQICESRKSCFFIDNFEFFSKDLDSPAICCGPLSMPHSAAGYSLNTYWNSFPKRYFRYLLFSKGKKDLPTACKACDTMNVSAYADSRGTKSDAGDDEETLSLYHKASQLEKTSSNGAAQKLLNQCLKLCQSDELQGKVHFQLGVIEVAGKRLGNAKECFQKAVQCHYGHTMAFSYLYLLSMIKGLEFPKMPRRRRVRMRTF